MSRTIVDLTKERDGLVKQLQEAQDNAKAQVETLQSELADLKQFKAQIEKDKLDTERQAIWINLLTYKSLMNIKN